MTQSKKLIEYKRVTHVFHIAYSMSNAGMKSLGEDLAAMDGMDPEGMFQVGEKDVKRKAISEMKTKDALAGMTKNGPFSQVIAQGLIVWLYGLWEEYRKAIGGELGWDTNDVMCDVMGDVRMIRNWITHDNGVADKDVSKLKVLSWPSKPEPILVTSDEMWELQERINLMEVYERVSS